MNQQNPMLDGIKLARAEQADPQRVAAIRELCFGANLASEVEGYILSGKPVATIKAELFDVLREAQKHDAEARKGVVGFPHEVATSTFFG